MNELETIQTGIIIDIPYLDLRVMEEILGKDDEYFDNEEWEENLGDLSLDLSDLTANWSYDSKIFTHNNNKLLFTVELIGDGMYAQAILYQLDENHSLVEISFTDPEYDAISGEWLIQLDEDVLSFNVQAKKD